jgi:hypothetical protein
MTIAHGGSTQGADNTTPVAHTTPTYGAQRLNIALINIRSDSAIGRNVPNPLTYGGVAMTQLATVRYDNVQWCDLFAYYQVAPLTGPNNLAVTWAAGLFAGGTYCMAISSYLYVDQTNPFFGAPVTATYASTGAPSLVVPSQTDQLVVDFLGIISSGAAGSGALTAGAGQVSRNTNETAIGGGSPGCGMSDEPGALSVTMSWAYIAQITGYIATALRPAVDPRTRAVKYFFNIWDPTYTIKDGIGAIEPNEVKQDNWIETDGFTLGESQTYPDFIRDPTKSRIVSITYRRSGVDIKVSKSQFADVIVARAAAGRM